MVPADCGMADDPPAGAPEFFMKVALLSAEPAETRVDPDPGLAPAGEGAEACMSISNGDPLGSIARRSSAHCPYIPAPQVGARWLAYAPKSSPSTGP